MAEENKEKKRIETLQLEEKKRIDEVEREKRAHDREMRKLEQELEIARLSSNDGTSSNARVDSKPSIKLSNYKDGEDVALYMRTFEKVKIANSWSDSVGLSALLNGFSGTKVSLFMSNLPADMTYDETKSQILKTFGYTVYDYQAKFHNSKQGSESFRQFVLIMKENFLKMCKLADVNCDYDNLLQLVVKDQILKSIDGELSDFLRERNIFKVDLDEVIQLADNYQAIHGRTVTMTDAGSKLEVRFCYKCGGRGHIAKNCVRNTANYYSEKPKFPESKFRDSKILTNKNCFICDKPGHMARDCRSQLNSKYARGNSTQQFDINAVMKPKLEYDKSLPVCFGMCNGKNVKILRDTGATTVLVRKSLIPKKFISNEKVMLNFADGRSVSAPKTKIKVDCAYYSGETEAVCLDGLPFDLLIGNIPGAVCACSAVAENYAEHENSVNMVQTRGQIQQEEKPEVPTKALQSEFLFDLDVLNTQELIALQKNDPKLKSYFEKIDENTCDYPKFTLKNGVLTKLCIKGKNIKDVVEQIVLPSQLTTKVMKLAHDPIFSGHLGVQKTIDRVTVHFVWPGCYSEIRRFCRSCETCQKHAINRPPKVPLVNIPVVSKPFSKVAMDLIGPLSKSRRGHRFALVVIDFATKYPDAIPLKKIDSLTVAEALIEIFGRVGLPNEIVHDQGTQFMSNVMQKFNQLLQIKSVNSTPYNPRANGTCENFNKTLKQMIRKMSSDDPQTWDRYLQPLLFAYREVPQTSTGFSPFELLFGYDVRGPLFLVKERILNLDCETEEIPVTTYVMEMRDRIREFLKTANDNETVSKKKQKLYYDKNCRARRFSIGDKVLLLLPTSSSKLVAEWKGPFEVVRKLNKVDYVIRMGDKERVFHINMLKKFNERTETVNFASDAEISTSSDGDADATYVCISEELSVEEYDQIKDVLKKI